MISIVTSYYNRRKQLINTLETVNKSKYIKDIEFVLVDDCSKDEERVEDLMDVYPFLRVIRLNSSDRWYTNPCVPYNIGLKEAKGDIIILQNPECLHVGDIVDNVVLNLNDTNYLTYSVYSLNQNDTQFLYDLNYKDENVFDVINSKINPTKESYGVSEGQTCWYNHSIFRPCGYHFISAIMKCNMDKLGGFDERFSNGIGFDDDELLFRIKLLGLNVNIIDAPFGIHQWHYSENNFIANSNNVFESFNKNKNIFENITKTNNSYYVKNT